MKAVISNRIYLNCDKDSKLDKDLCAELTYEISQEPVSPYPLVIKNLIRVSPTVVSIPSGRLDLIPDDYTIVDRRKYVDVEIPTPSFTPRESQQDAIDLLNCNGLVEAPVGF